MVMAGSVAQSWVEAVRPGSGLGRLVFDCVGDAADGTVPDTETAADIVGQVLAATTIPGETGPTDNWDFALVDEDGVDVLAGAGANRDTANAEQVAPLLGGVYAPRPVSGKLTLVVTNTSVNDAEFRIVVWVQRV
jgi:hypothetical protein